MARSTCNPDVEVPEGMMKFEVIRSTIRDSIGQYCVPGDMAVLTPRHAKSYLQANYIRVPLPAGFADAEESDDDEANAVLHAEGHAKPAADGRAEQRRQEVAARREAEAKLQAEAEAERERILAEARDEAARIVAEAEASAGPDTGASDGDSGGQPEESPTGGEAGSSPDTDREDTAERSEAAADPVKHPPKRRRRASANA